MRFRDLPLRLSYQDELGKLKSEVFRIIHLEGENLELLTYSGKRSKNKGKTLVLRIQDIRKGNLFLDI